MKVGEYRDECRSWIFPFEYYFAFLKKFNETMPQDKLSLEKLTPEIERILKGMLPFII